VAKSKIDVVNLIRQGIMNSEFLPNERLVEMDLATKYGVGRATIRLALAELENELLIVKEPNRGARVRAISLEEAIEITEVRYLLEPLVAQKAAEKITDSEIHILRSIIDQMKKAHTVKDFSTYSKLNKQLHNQIYTSARHLTATRILSNLKAQNVRYQYNLSLMPLRIDSSIMEHINIVEAIIYRNPEAAKNAMSDHISNMMAAYKNTSYHSYYI